MPLLAAMQLSMHLSRVSSPLPKKSVDPWWTVSEKCKMEDNHTHHICEEVSKIQLEQPGKFDDPRDDSGHGPVRASFRDLAQNCSHRPHAPAAGFQYWQPQDAWQKEGIEETCSYATDRSHCLMTLQLQGLAQVVNDTSRTAGIQEEVSKGLGFSFNRIDALQRASLYTPRFVCFAATSCYQH